MLKVVNLTKNYGSLKVLRGISFEIKKGTIYGFLGPNGAGKTTTMNILSGLIGYSEGEIYIDGRELKNNKRELLKKVGYLPQNPVFYGYMNALEYLCFIGEISGMGEREIKQRSEELLSIVKLQDAAKRRISGYSGGMKQRLGIAAALFKKPEIVFLDEPTSALDPEGRMEILEFIKNLKCTGTTVFLSTHILNDIERVCDEVSILSEGKILISDSIDDLKNKYVQPIFDVEFEDNCYFLKDKLSGIGWIQNILINGNKASIYVSQMETAKHELLKLIGALDLTVLSFNLRKSNLEDIFVRLVNEDVNI